MKREPFQGAGAEIVVRDLPIQRHDRRATGMSDALRASLAAASASIFFGASVVVTRFVVDAIDPILLAFIRFLIASLCLVPMLHLGSLGRFGARDVVAISGLGIVFFGMFPWLFNAGLALVPASRGALWLATMPLLTFVLASALRFEKVTMPKAMGTVLAAVGIALAVGDPGTPMVGPTWRGDLLMFATACCGAVYFVFSRPFLRRLPNLPVTSLSMVAGTVFLGCVSASMGTLAAPDLTGRGWLAVAFLGTFGGALGFSLWIWALQRSTPTRTAVFAPLNPIAATLLGALLLGEPLTASFLFGFVCVLAGIVTANLPGASVRHDQLLFGSRKPERSVGGEP
jgi:drug/metabolite transporter (DMT)-like permease